VIISLIKLGFEAVSFIRNSLAQPGILAESLLSKNCIYEADVVKKFIFRYLTVPLTNGSWNILWLPA
jgi:hypothetical protein